MNAGINNKVENYYGIRYVEPMKIITIILLLVWFIGCGPSSVNVKTSMELAQTAYSKLLTTNPEPLDVQGYRIYMAKAKSAYDNDDYSDAQAYAQQALEQADKAYNTRIQLKADAKNHIELTRTKMNSLLVPGQEAVHEFFEALDNYSTGKYRACLSLLSDVSKRLDINAQTAFLHSVTLYVPENLAGRFGKDVPVFAFMGNDFRLHKVIAQVKGPVEVDFVNQFFVRENFSYFHIKSDKLHIDGWVYPQFVVIGKIKVTHGEVK